jgi:hypothetical protein
MIDSLHPNAYTRADFLSGDIKIIQQESTFWKRSLWNKVGGKLGDYKLADDFELWLRFSQYASLYCTNAYLGGFRQRTKNQLSLEGMDKYMCECKDAVSKIIKTPLEKKIIRKVSFWNKIEKIRFLNKRISIKMIEKIYKKYYGPRNIEFDRMTQSFYIV